MQVSGPNGPPPGWRRLAAWALSSRRLRANVRCDANVIARPAGLAPNKSFRAGVRPEVADSKSAVSRDQDAGEEQRRHELPYRMYLHMYASSRSAEAKWKISTHSDLLALLHAGRF